jgi:hypothetical protein
MTGKCGTLGNMSFVSMREACGEVMDNKGQAQGHIEYRSAIEQMKETRIYMVSEYNHTLYNTAQSKEKCVCLEGFELDPGDSSNCIPSGGAQLDANRGFCSSAKVVGGTIVRERALGSHESTEMVNISLTDPHSFESCKLHFECQEEASDQKLFEHVCYVKDGECFVKEHHQTLSNCFGVLDPSHQTSANCAFASSPYIYGINFQANVSGGYGFVGDTSPSGCDEGVRRCDICYQHSCDEIETMLDAEFASTVHSHDIAFRVGITAVDTIGTCVLCEGNSSDESQCLFTDPEAKAHDWTICDKLCDFESCADLEVLLGRQLEEEWTFSKEKLSKYVQRFIYPLCFGCRAPAICLTNPMLETQRPAAEIEMATHTTSITQTDGGTTLVPHALSITFITFSGLLLLVAVVAVRALRQTNSENVRGEVEAHTARPLRPATSSTLL